MGVTATIAQRGIRQLPIVDDVGKLARIISVRDVLKLLG